MIDIQINEIGPEGKNFCPCFFAFRRVCRLKKRRSGFLQEKQVLAKYAIFVKYGFIFETWITCCFSRATVCFLPELCPGCRIEA